MNVSTTPFVNGTVANHNSPIEAPKTIATIGDGGNNINKVITTDLPR